MNIVATYGMGTFDRSSAATLARDREMRYSRLFHVVSSYLQQGLSVWVDGNFPTTAWRDALWLHARAYGVRDLVVLQCICSDSLVLHERFSRRRSDRSWPDAVANDLGAYEGSVAQFEPIGDDEMSGFAAAEVLVFDSCRAVLNPTQPHTRFGAIVQHTLTRLGFINSSGLPSRPSSTD